MISSVRLLAIGSTNRTATTVKIFLTSPLFSASPIRNIRTPATMLRKVSSTSCFFLAARYCASIFRQFRLNNACILPY